MKMQNQMILASKQHPFAGQNSQQSIYQGKDMIVKRFFRTIYVADWSYHSRPATELTSPDRACAKQLGDRRGSILLCLCHELVTTGNFDFPNFYTSCILFAWLNVSIV